MKANDYQLKALRTATGTKEEMIMECALGLAGEVGELADHIKKWKYQGHPIDRNYLKLEIGDILWYASSMAAAIDTLLSEVMEENIQKLNNRYPEGFSAERSINRKEHNE